MSDNGFLWGEHRLFGKELPYEESIRVPIVMRYDPLTSDARTDSRMALNLDIAPTFADVAGVAAPGVEGTSLLPLLAGRRPPWRTDFLVEHAKGSSDIPSYCEVRSLHSAYVLYADGETEFYDLVRDPFEMTNIAAEPSQRRRVDAMAGRLHELCLPAPPGFRGAP
jgi:arylsulfatase A-like enzyme